MRPVDFVVVLIDIMLQGDSNTSILDCFKRFLDEGLSQRLLLENYRRHHLLQ